jgi:hypothetical protein
LADCRAAAHPAALLVALQRLLDCFAVETVVTAELAILGGDNRAH